ncbi:MAG: hypothetical protein ABJZ69_10200, partial [Hyphomicrobiales bacterium]
MENLPMLNVPQTAAATWMMLFALVCLLFTMLVLSLTLFTSSGVFLFFPYFFTSSLFSGVCHIPYGGVHDSLFPIVFLILFRLALSSVFCFFLCFVLFLYFMECVRSACRIVVVVVVFFTLNRSFYASTSSTTSVRADSSNLE